MRLFTTGSLLFPFQQSKYTVSFVVTNNLCPKYRAASNLTIQHGKTLMSYLPIQVAIHDVTPLLMSRRTFSEQKLFSGIRLSRTHTHARNNFIPVQKILIGFFFLDARTSRTVSHHSFGI